MTLLQKLKRLVKDPPAEFVFEIPASWAGVGRNGAARGTRCLVPWSDGRGAGEPVNPNFGGVTVGRAVL